jgi:WbqC-like protein family
MASGLSCAIHQPNLFPRLSTLAKLHAAGAWVVLDDVQFTRGAYQQRCRLAATSDPTRQQWLTVPVHLPHGRATPINQVQVSDPEATRHRMYRLLQQYYARSRYWPAFEHTLSQVLATLDTTDRLAGLSEASTQALLTLTGWRGTISRSSGLTARTDKSQRLAELTCATGATTYLCGTGGARYLDYWPFALHGLQVVLFTSPARGDPRVWQGASKISALRALMNVGPVALSAVLHQHAAWLTQQPAAAVSQAVLSAAAHAH